MIDLLLRTMQAQSLQYFFTTIVFGCGKREKFVKKMKDTEYNTNTKHLIAYSIQNIFHSLFIVTFIRKDACSVTRPDQKLISFQVNNSVCKLIIYEL